jgi:hypothetical protein
MEVKLKRNDFRLPIQTAIATDCAFQVTHWDKEQEQTSAPLI